MNFSYFEFYYDCYFNSQQADVIPIASGFIRSYFAAIVYFAVDKFNDPMIILHFRMIDCKKGGIMILIAL